MPAPPRLLPDVPLPAYPFVPGLAPHPYSDPHGHRYAPDLPAPQPPDPERWRDSPHFLLGLDLFNCGYYWEAHEMWERLWHAAGRRGAVADFLKALIKLAAAGVKHREGTPDGVRSHARRAAELWRRVRGDRQGGPDPFLGLSFLSLIALGDRIARDGWPDDPVVLVPGED